MTHARSLVAKFALTVLVYIAVLLVFCLPVAFAQTSGTGALTGTVNDPSGAVIAGANVVADNKATGQERTTITDASGAYKLSLLPPGDYSLKFTAPGFQTLEVGSVTINVTETAVLNQRLEIGGQETQVTVESTVETIQTQNATVGALVGSRTVTDLPLVTRNYTQIIDLSPGVVANVASASAIGNGTQDINVNGSGSDQNNYQMDGASITNYASGGGAQSGNYAGIGIPNPDSIQEFKIQTSQYDAGYGRNPGASVNVVTKGGTNQFHGAAWEFFRNEALDANDYLFRISEEKLGEPNKPQVLRQNTFGGTLGGPIKKDRLFFFGSYQGFRQLNGIGTNGFANGYTTGLTLLPWNDPSDPSNPRHIGDVAGYKNYLGSVFGGGDNKGFGTGITVAPDGSNISNTVVNVLQASGPKGGLNGGFYVPSAPSACSTSDTGCVVNVSQPVQANENQFLANSDYVISSKHTLSERYFFSSDPQVQSFVCLGPCDPGAPEKATYTSHEGVLKLTSVLTSTFVNEARFSFQRNVTNSQDLVSTTSCSVGIIPQVNNGADCPIVAGAVKELSLIPVISISGVASPSGAWNLGGNFFAADTNYINVFQGADQISWTHGKQTIRAGFEAERTQWNNTLPSTGRGDIYFWNVADFLTSSSGLAVDNTPATSGGIFLNFTSKGPLTGARHLNRINAFSSFIQNDIKVNSRLTVNLGLRWEYNGWPDDISGQFTNVWASQAALVNTGSFFINNPRGTLAGYVVPSNFDVKDFGLTAPNGTTGVYVNSNKTLLPGSPLTNFGPRIGFAWQPVGAGKFVVRGGYGIFYDRVYGNLLVDNQQSNPPYAGSAGGSFPQNLVETLHNPFLTGDLQWTPRTLTSGLGSTSDSQYMVTPLVQEYNLGIQYEFIPGWVAEIGYVGTHGVRLYNWSQDINIAHLVAGAPNEPTDVQNSKLVSSSLPYNDPNNTAPLTSNSTGNVSNRVSYLGFSSTGMATTNTNGDSLYNSLQAVLRHQFSHGLLLQASYTWSKSITNVNASEAGAGIAAPGNVLSGGSNLNNPLDLRQQYGLAAFNRPQRLVISYSYDLPWKHTEGLAGKALGGWTVSGVTTIQDGEPFSVEDGAGGSIYYGTGSTNARAQLADPVKCTAAGVCQSGIPIATSGSIKCRLGLATQYTGCSTQQGYINKNAFTSEPCIGGTVQGNCAGSGGGTGFGDSAVGSIMGPGQHNWDMSFIKNTKLTEALNLQFRAEFYNIWNHAQFNAPGAGSTAYNDRNASANFGHITATSVPPRVVQFALKFLF